MKNIGLIVNPLAGMGGPAGMKGSDRAECVIRARELGIKPIAYGRAEDVLVRLKSGDTAEFRLYTAPGEMGEEEAKQAGYSPVVIGEIEGGNTSAEDTKRIAKLMVEQKLDLLVFVGGDGTARDVCEAIGTDIPAMGIPSGVKMHSAVFTLHMAAAAQVLSEFINKGAVEDEMREVMDLDEEAYTGGRVSAKLYGYLRVPHVRRLFQSLKAGGGTGNGGDSRAIAGNIFDRMKKETEYTYLIGAGSTTMAVKNALGIDGTLLGVDVVKDGRLMEKDVCSCQLEEIAKRDKIKIIVTPIGGQGFIFGRGNQQFSPGVIRAAGRQNIMVICTPGKLTALEGQPLLVDTGSEETDKMLHGYMRLITGRKDETVYRIAPTLD